MDKPDALLWHPDHRDSNRDNMDLVLLKPELFMISALEGSGLQKSEARCSEGDLSLELRASLGGLSCNHGQGTEGHQG